MPDIKRVIQEIQRGDISQALSDDVKAEIDAISQEDLFKKVTLALQHPKPDVPLFILDIVHAAEFYLVFEELGMPKNLSVYEPGVGGCDPVVIATEAYSSGLGNYLTINLNKDLQNELAGKIDHHKISIRIIQDNAQQALKHLEPNTFDIACFNHSINDILQTVVSEHRGMDTVNIDWFSNEQQMIEWLTEDFADGSINSRGKPELIEIITTTLKLMRPGGYMVLCHNNYEFIKDKDWFPWQLYWDLIPITREWIKQADLPVKEVTLPGFESQWWMFLEIK